LCGMSKPTTWLAWGIENRSMFFVSKNGEVGSQDWRATAS